MLTFTLPAGGRKALVAGDVHLDRLLDGDVPGLSTTAPIPVLHCHSDTLATGGAANVAANLAALGVACDLVATAGAGAGGDRGDFGCCALAEQLRRLRRTHAWTSHPGHHLVTFYHLLVPGYQTPVAARLTGGGRPLLQVYWGDGLPIPEHLGVAGLHQGWLDQHDLAGYAALALVDRDRGALSEVTRQQYLQLAARANVPSILACRDPMPLPSWKMAAAVCMPEAAFMAAGATCGAGTKQPVTAARRLAEVSGLQKLVVTMGPGGLFYYDAPSGFFATHAAPSVTEVDSAGAGDVVTAVLTAALATGMDLGLAAHPAALAAALAAGRPGTCVVDPYELNCRRGAAVPPFKSITSLEEADSWSWYAHQAGKKIVFASGCFDLFHAGHLSFLERCRQLGDALVVAVSEDELVRFSKGPGRPVIPFMERSAILQALPCVDAVTCHSDYKTLLDLVRAVKPAVLAQGEEWREQHVVGADLVAAHGGQVQFLSPYNKDTCRTAAITARAAVAAAAAPAWNAAASQCR